MDEISKRIKSEVNQFYKNVILQCIVRDTLENNPNTSVWAMLSDLEEKYGDETGLVFIKKDKDMQNTIMDIIEISNDSAEYDSKGAMTKALPVIENALINFCDQDIPESVKQILSMGFRNYPNIQMPFFTFLNEFCKVFKTTFYVADAIRFTQELTFNSIRVMCKLNSIICSFTKSPFRHTMQVALEECLLFLQSHKDIVFFDMPLRSQMVMMSKQEYLDTEKKYVQENIEKGLWEKVVDHIAKFAIIHNEFVALSEKLSIDCIIAWKVVPYWKTILQTCEDSSGELEINPLWDSSLWYTYPFEKMLVKYLGARFRKLFPVDELCCIDDLAAILRTLNYDANSELLRCDLKITERTLGKDEILDAINYWIAKCPSTKDTDALFIEVAKFILDNGCYFSYNNEVYLLKDSAIAFLTESQFLESMWFQMRIDQFSPKVGLKVWKKNNSLLFRIPKKFITEFKLLFTSSISFPMAFEGMSPGDDGYPTIEFMNVCISKRHGAYLCKIFFPQQSFRRMLHYGALTTFKDKLQSSKQIINTVLLTTSNEFLLDDLMQLEHLFYHNSYSPTMVTGLFINCIQEEMKKLENSTSLVKVNRNVNYGRRHALNYLLARFICVDFIPTNIIN